MTYGWLTQELVAAHRYMLDDSAVTEVEDVAHWSLTRLLGEIDHARLPHRLCWFEWTRRPTDPETEVVPADMVAPTKRIGMLCRASEDHIACMLAWSGYDLRMPQFSPIILMWHYQPHPNGMTITDTELALFHGGEPDSEKEASRLLWKRQRYPPSGFHHLAYPIDMRERHADILRQQQAVLMSDWRGEWRILLAMLLAIHGGRITEHPGPDLSCLNRSRVRSRKQPLMSYHILTGPPI